MKHHSEINCPFMMAISLEFVYVNQPPPPPLLLFWMYLLVTSMYLQWQIRPDLGRIEKWILRNAFDDEQNPYLPKVGVIALLLHSHPSIRSNFLHVFFLFFVFPYIFLYLTWICNICAIIVGILCFLVIAHIIQAEGTV